jgi:sugar lactone lactonase YvrE
MDPIDGRRADLSRGGDLSVTMQFSERHCVAVIALLLASGCGGNSPTPNVRSVRDLHITAAYRVILEASGTVLVPDGGTNAVLRVDPRTGKVSSVTGSGSALSGVGGPAAKASLGKLRDVAEGSDRSIYVALQSEQVVRIDAGTTILTVVAGTGQRGFGGDGGPAVAAQLDGALGLTVDAGDNLFIAEFGNRVRRVDAKTGLIGTFAGTGDQGSAGDGGPAKRAQLNQPHGLASDSDGAIYIADTSNNQIRRVSTDGVITTLANRGLNIPTGVTVAADHSILIADFGSNRVLRLKSTGTIDTAVDGVTGPTGVAVGRDGTIYVSELDAGLLRVEPNGNRSRIG